MGDRSRISWCDASWNPISGCTKVSPGCAHCYAEAITLRFKRGPAYLPGVSKVQLHPERLGQPLRWRRPRRIFVCSMSDLFHEDVPDEFIARCFEVMHKAGGHTFQILTKRPGRMISFFARMKPRWNFVPRPLPNVWLGVSVENQYWADRRIPLLLQTPAAIRFLSMEPLLKPVDLGPWLDPSHWGHVTGGPQGWQPDPVGIHWVIVGGESGPRHRPMDPAWVEDIAGQCRAAGVPVFVKQDAGPKPGQQGRLSDDLWALKEFPAQAVICAS